MPRPLGIQYTDAWYHIMNRGRRSEVIFSRKEDYYVFTDLLKGVVDKYDVKLMKGAI